MISFFRRFFQSKVGIGVTLAFLVVIGLAFASSDVANTGMFGGVSGGDRVAVVGDRAITASDLSENVSNAMEQQRQTNPTLSLQGFIGQGGLDDVLESMLDRAAIAEFAEMLGLRAGSRLVDSEITSAPGFQGADGSFDAEAFRAQLAQRGLSESTVREDLALSLLARQMILPIAYQTRLPASIARTYAQMRNESRVGTAAAFPADAYAPAGAPSTQQLQAYYRDNRARYIRPERRVLRYAVFTEDALPDVPAVTDAQIAAAYRENAARYQAREQRTFTQLVVPTEAAAQAVIDEVRSGTTLQASATSKGLSTTTVEDVEQAAFAASASQAVARAAFAADRGAIAGPVRGQLGWYVLRVDNVTAIPARSLAQASAEIRTALEAEARTETLGNFTEELEDRFARGGSLEEAAEDLGLEIQSTPPLLANGQVYGQQAQAPAELARIVATAFEMDEGDPMLQEVVPGQAFLIFDVGEITPSAAAPLAEIRETVIAQWRRDRGMAAAGEAAQRVLARVERGASLADAVARETAELPPTQRLDISRRELEELGQGNRATVLLFSMAEGTAKRVEVAEQDRWFVLELDTINTPELAAGDPLIANTQAQVSALLGDEYVAQFVDAASAMLEVERNEDGIQAVRDSLTGAATN